MCGRASESSHREPWGQARLNFWVYRRNRDGRQRCFLLGPEGAAALSDTLSLAYRVALMADPEENRGGAS